MSGASLGEPTWVIFFIILWHACVNKYAFCKAYESPPKPTHHI